VSDTDLDPATLAAELLGLDANDPVVEAARQAVRSKRLQNVVAAAVAKQDAQAKAEKAAVEQPRGDDRFADFDAHFAELDDDRTPVRIRLFGRLWDLGCDLPAAAVLRLGRLAADESIQDLDLTDPRIKGEVILLAGDLIPAPVLAEWLGRGLDDRRLGEIVLWVFGQHQYGQTGGSAEGEATAPETGASGSSSNGGLSSSATSTASTPSTSTSVASSPG